ncbi:hippocalcin-like protein 1 [Styela clava]|uniref:neuronal calcium sensor 2-like n=1 Tax=Styela clava TaxID=7725 RepID=UPI0019399747|nr:neuronal calcium sensor 2-like [Styela clava]
MGQSSNKLNKKDIEALAGETKLDGEKVQEMYKDFLKQCPNGKITKKQFIGMYQQRFPGGNGTDVAERLFRGFDKNNDGIIDFREFIITEYVKSQGSPEKKLELAFGLYDIDENGYISLTEMMEIFKAIHNTLPEEQRKGGMADVRNRTKQKFEKLDDNGDGQISKAEFVEGAKDDPELLEILRK